MSRVAIQSCDLHRPLLCWDSDLQVICMIKSRIRLCVRVCGLVVVCRVEIGLRKQVLHKLDFIP
jgi:hypothetical protein